MAVDIYGREIINKFLCQKDTVKDGVITDSKIYFVKNFAKEVLYKRAVVSINVDIYSLLSSEEITKKREAMLASLKDEWLNQQVYSFTDSISFEDYLKERGGDENALWIGENYQKRQEITAFYDALTDEEKEKIVIPSDKKFIFENSLINSLPTPRKIVEIRDDNNNVIEKTLEEDKTLTIFDQELFENLNKMLCEFKNFKTPL